MPWSHREHRRGGLTPGLASSPDRMHLRDINTRDPDARCTASVWSGECLGLGFWRLVLRRCADLGYSSAESWRSWARVLFGPEASGTSGNIDRHQKWARVLACCFEAARTQGGDGTWVSQADFLALAWTTLEAADDVPCHHEEVGASTIQKRQFLLLYDSSGKPLAGTWLFRIPYKRAFCPFHMLSVRSGRRPLNKQGQNHVRQSPVGF